MAPLRVAVQTRSGKPFADVTLDSEVRCGGAWASGWGSPELPRREPGRHARHRQPRNVTQATVAELKKKIHAAKKACYPARQRLTLPPPPGKKSGDVLSDSATLGSLGLTDGAVVLFKDLGPQARCAAAAGRLARGAGASRMVTAPQHDAARRSRSRDAPVVAWPPPTQQRGPG